MEFIKNHFSIVFLGVVFCLIGCEGSYEHEYVLVNQSSSSLAILQTGYISVELDSVNNKDSMYVDTLLIEPAQMRVINTISDFGNMPRKKQLCWDSFEYDTIYQVNQNQFTPILLRSDLLWEVTYYDKNQGQQCTSIIVDVLIDNSGL
jgi:hypothetical protein